MTAKDGEGRKVLFWNDGSAGRRTVSTLRGSFDKLRMTVLVPLHVKLSGESEMNEVETSNKRRG